jgi:hypothetical protein
MCLRLLRKHEPADEDTMHARHVANCPPSVTANRTAQFNPALLTHTWNSYFHETGRFTATLKKVFGLSCHITIVLNKTANGVLGHGEHLIKGSYAVTGHVEMQLHLRQSRKYGLMSADFRENSYKLSVERWADIFAQFHPHLTTNVDNTDRNAFPPLTKVWHSLCRYSRNAKSLNKNLWISVPNVNQTGWNV